MRCLETMKITEILRLREMGFKLREISDAVGCSKTTVGEILTRCKACDLRYEDAITLPQGRLNELIYPESFGRKQVKEEPDWEAIHARLQSSRRINLQYIWEEEYRPANPDGYSYSRFCAKYNDWKDSTGKNVIMAQEQEPGKELFLDWMGDTLDCVMDYNTGELHKAHFFVTTMAESSYPFVEAFPDETQMNWNQAHLDAFEWYGGLPRILVPDTHVVYSTNSQILEDYNKPRLVEHKGYNHMHLNGFVDVVSKAFLNVVIQPGQHPDERKALHTMLDSFKPDDPGQYIITADRGYESYDLIFHCEIKSLFYVFRVKSPSSPRSLLSTFKDDLPDDSDEFDVIVRRFVTDMKTKNMKEQSSVYLYMNPDKNIPHFRDFLITEHLGHLSFRVLKIKTSENTCEYIITNLPGTFDMEDIKECYHWRWGIMPISA